MTAARCAKCGAYPNSCAECRRRATTTRSDDGFNHGVATGMLINQPTYHPPACPTPDTSSDSCDSGSSGGGCE